MNKFFACLLVLAGCVFTSQAHALIINPNDDGSIFSNNSVDRDNELFVSGGTRGVVEFSLSGINPSLITDADLSINPYGLPLFDLSVELWGYGSNDGALTASDYNAGTFLGIWNLPANLDYDQKAYYDVTNFLQSVSTPFVGFNLRTGPSGTDVFSSLEFNYGSPSQLSVTVAPEPVSSVLMVLGGAAMALRRRLTC